MGLNFTDKSSTYLAALQLIFSSGKLFLVPGSCGLLAGSLYRLNVLGIRKLKIFKVFPSFHKHFFTIKWFIANLIRWRIPQGQHLHMLETISMSPQTSCGNHNHWADELFCRKCLPILVWTNYKTGSSVNQSDGCLYLEVPSWLWYLVLMLL